MTTKNLDKVIYRVQFKSEKTQYDIYVRHIYPSDMPGFICLEDFLFHEESQLLIDPRIERLQQEFANVETAFIPYYHVIRIDKVSKSGESRIKEGVEPNSKVIPFPNKP